MRRPLVALAMALLLTGGGTPKVKPVEPAYNFIPGSVPLDRRGLF